MTDGRQTIWKRGATDSRLVALVFNDSRTPARVVAATVIGAASEVAVMAALGLMGPGRVLGLPGPLAVAIAAAVGIYAGTGAGVFVAAVGVFAYVAFLSEFGRLVHPEVVIPSAILWISLSYVIARGGNSVRRQVIGRLEAQDQTEALYRRLERSLLPKVPVTHPLLGVATFYLPGVKGLRLGGDFFDLATIDGGVLAVVVGDVSGHGPRAAALGAMLRGAWRGLVAENTPASTAQALHQIALADGAADDAYATAVFAWIDPDRGEVSIMSAGHPAPLLITGQVTELDVAPVPPLGYLNGDRPWKLTTMPLPADWSLLFYTDGLTEMRTHPDATERDGLPALCERLAATGHPVTDEGLARVVADLAAASGESPLDDVAIVAVNSVSPK